jgi:hypothetical protein
MSTSQVLGFAGTATLFLIHAAIIGDAVFVAVQMVLVQGIGSRLMQSVDIISKGRTTPHRMNHP